MKNVIIFVEERFSKSRDGKYYSTVFNDSFWERYLSIFDNVKIFARVESAYDSKILLDKNCLSDPRVSIIEAPYYHGILSFTSAFFNLFFMIFEVSKKDSKFILRLPGALGSIACFCLLLRRKSYGVELVGDPFQVFSTGGVGGSIRLLLKWSFYHVTRLACIKAVAVAYVTRVTMQKIYPHSKQAFSTYYSSIVLDKELIVNHKEIRVLQTESPISLLAVGTMEQRYKGFDLLIHALSKVIKIYPNACLTLVGDGLYKNELFQLAEKLKVNESVIFSGKVDRDKVFEYMDDSDIFIIPSRTEGVPRVLIEAFARGLPAVGSRVGGIPELLDDEFVFSNENIDQIVNMIIKVISDTSLRKVMSERNISRAGEFESDVLSKRRELFYMHLLQVS